uniref:Uncharacterized protein n=1 Tax=Timema douglasi TaxID=61478 RepID=A0A7R8VZ47_TIMDO|nr:unnamed protein product [Timema douglasi]
MRGVREAIMSSYSSFSMSTRRKEAFSEELGTMLGRRSVMTSSEEHHITTFFRQQSEEFGGVEIQEILDEQSFGEVDNCVAPHVGINSVDLDRKASRHRPPRVTLAT